MKAIERYFNLVTVMFRMLFKVTLLFLKCMDETLVCDHTNESFKQY